jgi:prolyl oligopeptidase
MRVAMSAACRRISLLAAGLVACGAARAATTDPYLWLEDLGSTRAMDWVHAENARSLKVLQADPRYQPFFDQALAIAQAADRIPKPQLVGHDVYNLWQDATHAQGLWRHTTQAGFRLAAPDWHTDIDLDALSRAEHATWVLEGADCEEPEARRCLVSLSQGGEDAVSVREFDLASSGFVGGGFDIPHAKQEEDWEGADTILIATDWGPGSMTASGYPFIVKRLHRGQPLVQATEVFRGTPADVSVRIEGFVDGQGHRAMVLQRGLDFFRSEFRLVTPTGTVRLALPEKASVKGLARGQLIALIEESVGPGLPAGSLVSLDIAHLASPPRLILAPGPRQSIDDARTTRDGIVASLLDQVRGRAITFTADKDGNWTAHTLALPDNAAIKLVTADSEDDHAYLQVESFLLPATLFVADAAAPASAPVAAKTIPAQFDAARDVAEQLQATSADGTRIPYFLVHPKNQAAPNATLLTGYGGFGVSEVPAYNPTIGKLWLEQGGSYALANIRGGGEFGPAWHEAGLKTHRQVIYDDFAAVAKDMEARHLTTPALLGIRGRSNGGLLMGVEFEQHPDLWNAVIIGVPLLDMLRFEHIAAGASWVGEYGSTANPDERAFLAGISPYANLKPNVRYPTPYIFTTTSDDRVGPAHARKFAALMEAQGHPFLYYEAIEGGHVASANLRGSALEQALEMTYLRERLH